MPTAEVQPLGSVRLGWSNSNPLPDRYDSDGLANYTVSLGLLPGLELDGRIFDAPAGGTRDLSFNGKYRVNLPWGAGLALGVTDFGGEAPHFRSTYAAATLPWQTLRFTAGYGIGPDILKGAFGGMEWRPWDFAGVSVEHDTRDVNAGLKLDTAALLGRVKLGASGLWRGETKSVDYGAQLEIAMDRMSTLPELAPEAEASARGATLIDTLHNLGFESVRVGKRGTVQVVALENRVYNHSSADGLAVALSAVAAQMAPGTQTIELTLFAYGLPQVTVTTDRALSRFDVRNSGGVPDEAAMEWDVGSVDGLSSGELILEPLLRTFVATEYGVLDYGLGARARYVQPMGRGAILNAGVTLPLAKSNDFKPGQNFEGFAPRAGLDLLLLQWVQKLTPSWTTLWSLGQSRVINIGLETVANESLWVSEQGTQQLRSKLIFQRSSLETFVTALGGYTWFDPARDYSLSLTGGRFFAKDTGLRVDFSRYFGDTICTLFYKAASGDDAAGILVTLPLTPRRDAQPGGLQVKGSRRWGHNLATTVNTADGRNALRPLLLFEPVLDLDLRRDFADSARLGAAYLQDELPKRLQ